MRRRTTYRRTVTAAIINLIGATAFTSLMIDLNQRPNGVVWFPWIITGWVLTAGSAAWFGVVLSALAIVQTRVMTTPRTRHTDTGRPPVRPRELKRELRTTLIPQEASPEEIAAMGAEFTAGVRAATGRTPEPEPEPDLEAVAGRVRDGFATRTGGTPEAMAAFDTAVQGKPAGYTPSHGIDPITGRLYVDGKPVMPSAVQRVLIPQNPSPGLTEALVRAHGGTTRERTFSVGDTVDVNPAVTVTEADV